MSPPLWFLLLILLICFVLIISIRWPRKREKKPWVLIGSTRDYTFEAKVFPASELKMCQVLADESRALGFTFETGTCHLLTSRPVFRGVTHQGPPLYLRYGLFPSRAETVYLAEDRSPAGAVLALKGQSLKIDLSPNYVSNESRLVGVWSTVPVTHQRYEMALHRPKPGFYVDHPDCPRYRLRLPSKRYRYCLYL